MASTAANHAPMGAVATLRVVEFFENIRNAFIQWNQARVTRNILLGMSADRLEDIGVTRTDIA